MYKRSAKTIDEIWPAWIDLSSVTIAATLPSLIIQKSQKICKAELQIPCLISFDIGWYALPTSQTFSRSAKYKQLFCNVLGSILLPVFAVSSCELLAKQLWTESGAFTDHWCFVFIYKWVILYININHSSLKQCNSSASRNTPSAWIHEKTKWNHKQNVNNVKCLRNVNNWTHRQTSEKARKKTSGK